MAESQLINQFLIAMPNLADPNFAHSVTYIFQHDEQGAIGIMVNKPMQIELGEMLNNLDIQTQTNEITHLPVMMGGPVQLERGFVFHHPIGSWQSTLHVNEAFAITTSRDILEAIALGKGPKQVLVALGYAGWGPGQLEHELGENAWLSGPSSPEIIFQTPPDKRWLQATTLLGIDITQLSHQAGHA